MATKLTLYMVLYDNVSCELDLPVAMLKIEVVGVESSMAMLNSYVTCCSSFHSKTAVIFSTL